MNNLDWKNKGTLVSVYDKDIFVIDKGKSKDTLVILHGYPTSSYDYYKVLPELSRHYRVIIHDHLGFGFSEKPLEYSYSIIEQADVALQLWKQMGLTNVTLLAHDYGTSIATEIIARHNKHQINLQIDQLILCNGSMHIELSKLRVIQKLLRNKITRKWVAKMTNFSLYKKNLRNIFFDKKKISDEELQEIGFNYYTIGGKNNSYFIELY